MNRALPPRDRGYRGSDPGRPSRRRRSVPGAGRLVCRVEADQGRDRQMNERERTRAHGVFKNQSRIDGGALVREERDKHKDEYSGED